MQSFLTVFILYISWGLGDIFAKLAADRIGGKALFWHYTSYVLGIIVYSLYVYQKDSLWKTDQKGILLAICAGVVSVAGAICLYKLLATNDLSIVSSLISLKPALIAFVAILLLQEKITPEKIVGIVLAASSFYLLSR